MITDKMIYFVKKQFFLPEIFFWFAFPTQFYIETLRNLRMVPKANFFRVLILNRFIKLKTMDSQFFFHEKLPQNPISLPSIPDLITCW